MEIGNISLDFFQLVSCENVYKGDGEGGITGDADFTVLIFIAFSLHEVDRESSLNCVVADEEVQGKGDVGAGEDPPWKIFVLVLLVF